MVIYAHDSHGFFSKPKLSDIRKKSNKRLRGFKARKDFKGEKVFYVALNLVASFVFNNKNI